MSALIRLIVLVARLWVFCMCVEYVSLGSRVSPSIFGFFTVGSRSLFIWRVKVVLYCAGSGVKRIVVVLEVFNDSWLHCVQSCIWCRYGCTCACAVSMFVWEERMVMSSAYVMMWTFGGGVGRSAM